MGRRAGGRGGRGGTERTDGAGRAREFKHSPFHIEPLTLIEPQSTELTLVNGAKRSLPYSMGFELVMGRQGRDGRGEDPLTL